MSTIADVRFTHENGALAHTLETLSDVEANVIRETGTEPERSRYFIRFDGPDPETVRAVLENDYTVSRAAPVSESRERRVWSVEFAQETKLLNPLVTRENGFVVHARVVSETEGACWHERWLLPNHEALSRIWQHALEEAFHFEILDFKPWEGTLSTHAVTEVLTEEQRETLLLAYERGYFTEPRETDLETLGAELDVSPSAVAGRLKRGMKLLIEETLLVGDSETYKA